MSLDPQVQFVTVHGLKLAYRESGTSSQPPMVLLHGLAETSAFFWRPLIARFASRYRIIAFDLLGHGDSPVPSDGYEVEKQAALIADAMEQLHLSGAVIVGHSMGGVIGARLSIENPHLVSKLVLYDSPLSEGPRKNLLMFWRSVPFTALMLLGLVIFPRSIARLGVSLAPLRLSTRLILRHWRVPYHRERMDGEFLDHATRNSSTALMECARSTYITHNIVRDLNRLRLPTCMIVGDSDRLLPVPVASSAVRLIPNARLEVIQNAGHVALLDQPAAFNQALAGFLEK